ncbi:Mitochondrial metalloendopeptidase OMA1 [Gracilariopsis chorda]|uniref:Mitochondrial metalloendopeptidase OMA1 n=1 Tax=Gracilariopsis chorda TaxID=448386 RepID=A0A2V3IHL1_9FLOR|nr:Mitochondrial metalloendopeptidase OMA1 [Gracilariopsis chorda]|eukprot:PXF41567.1 Mitochondrial metalloendopeptidase OMA1 [Gracilariopsis chorda]
MSTQREMELGRRTYDELIHSVQRAVLEPNDAHSLRARRVVTRLARACKGLDAELSKGFKWSVAVCEDDMPNAVCVPGGRMLVTTGLLRLCSCDEEVAMVLSHEIAHAINRHSAEKMQVQMLMLPLVVVLSAVLSSHMMSASVSKLLLELPYGRKLEREADAVGLIVMTEACYDPRKGPVVFDKLAAVTREEEGGWISKRVKSMVSTHPMSKERAWQLRQQAAALALRFDERCVGAQTKALSIHDAGARCASPRGGTA